MGGGGGVMYLHKCVISKVAPIWLFTDYPISDISMPIPIRFTDIQNLQCNTHNAEVNHDMTESSN